MNFKTGNRTGFIEHNCPALILKQRGIATI